MKSMSTALVFVVLATACGGSAGNVTGATTATTESPVVTTTDLPETTAPPSETTTSSKGIDLVSQGKSLAARAGCTACHSTDGRPLIGPTWQGLYGRQESLADGSTVMVDDAYLRESIVDPNAKIVDGYTANIMPADFGDRLTDEDIDAIIAYIKSLG